MMMLGIVFHVFVLGAIWARILNKLGAYHAPLQLMLFGGVVCGCDRHLLSSIRSL